MRRIPDSVKAQCNYDNMESELTRLRTENARLREALGKIANHPMEGKGLLSQLMRKIAEEALK